MGKGGRIWKETGWWIAPRTPRDVMSVVGAIGVHSSGQRFAWRGMSSVDYAVTSSLHRRLGALRTDEAQLRIAEMQSLSGAREWGLGIGDSEYLDDLEVLSDMQHYGIATRLIDVSSNPMTALWFACQPPSLRDVARSGVLLALNISSWPHLISVGERAAPEAGRAANEVTLADALEKMAPFVVDAAHPNDRLRAQEGFFVASAVPESRDRGPFTSLRMSYPTGDPNWLESTLSGARSRGGPPKLPFVAVIIERQLKAKLLRYLEGTYNRSARVLFPDYAGFGEFAAHGGRGGEPGGMQLRS